MQACSDTNNKKAVSTQGQNSFLSFHRQNYFAKNSFTLSLCTIASLKVYAPVLGLRTALITFVQFFASGQRNCDH